MSDIQEITYDQYTKLKKKIITGQTNTSRYRTCYTIVFDLESRTFFRVKRLRFKSVL